MIVHQQRQLQSNRKEHDTLKYNDDIREYAKSRGVRHWEIAYALGIGDCWFSRKLNRPLPPEEKAKIMATIDMVASRREGM